MPDRVVLDTGIIFTVYFKEGASSRAKKVAAENDPITVDLAAAEKEQTSLLTLDKKLYDKAKANRDVRLV